MISYNFTITNSIYQHDDITENVLPWVTRTKSGGRYRVQYCRPCTGNASPLKDSSSLTCATLEGQSIIVAALSFLFGLSLVLSEVGLVEMGLSNKVLAYRGMIIVGWCYVFVATSGFPRSSLVFAQTQAAESSSQSDKTNSVYMLHVKPFPCKFLHILTQWINNLALWITLFGLR